MADHPPVPPSPTPRWHSLATQRAQEWASRSCVRPLPSVSNEELRLALTPMADRPTPENPVPSAPGTAGGRPGGAPVSLESVLKAWLSPAQYRGYLLGKSLEQLHGACGDRPTVRTAAVRDTMTQLSLFDEELL